MEDPEHKDEFPSLSFRFSEDKELLRRLLHKEGLQFLELHHLAAYPAEIYPFLYSLNRHYSVYVHDYALFCQRVSLLGPDGAYCGEPEPSACVTCIAIAGRNVKTEDPVSTYLAHSAQLLTQAHAVYAPSHDAAYRMARHFPGLKCRIIPLQKDAYREKCKIYPVKEESCFIPASGALLSPQHAANKRVRLCVVGAIGREKGYDILHHAALDAAQKNLPLEFVIVGHTPNDQLLLNTGRIFITGPYHEKEAVSLIQSFKSDAAFFPSIWPETWCLTLGLAWQAGLPAFVFDHGAPAERVRHTRRGWLLNSKLRASALNQVLINTVLGCKNSNDTKNHNTLVNL